MYQPRPLPMNFSAAQVRELKAGCTTHRIRVGLENTETLGVAEANEIWPSLRLEDKGAVRFSERSAFGYHPRLEVLSDLLESDADGAPQYATLTPRFAAGDIVFVRERYRVPLAFDSMRTTGAAQLMQSAGGACVHYEADGPPECPSRWGQPRLAKRMARYYSRFHLEITRVRAEHVGKLPEWVISFNSTLLVSGRGV